MHDNTAPLNLLSHACFSSLCSERKFEPRIFGGKQTLGESLFLLGDTRRFYPTPSIFIKHDTGWLSRWVRWRRTHVRVVYYKTRSRLRACVRNVWARRETLLKRRWSINALCVCVVLLGWWWCDRLLRRPRPSFVAYARTNLLSTPAAPFEKFSTDEEAYSLPNVYCVWSNLPASGDRFVMNSAGGIIASARQRCPSCLAAPFLVIGLCVILTKKGFRYFW